ncbi:hypothetical protein PoB_001599300 [Plakobranchus ocellatus]|uniref:Uncharacterized protein n=1 Tax=Plakobranchus ocellatus TaxID=259542 RepID=A0AAV3Z4D2_9GAST|nr:hypothetical protein PoB_001599300 [Plakobranchus ocellatus]
MLIEDDNSLYGTTGLQAVLTKGDKTSDGGPGVTVGRITELQIEDCWTTGSGYLTKDTNHRKATGLQKEFQKKVISGFQALRQARAPVAGLEPATEWSLQISGRTR